jgi:outer membrane protein assembly factor BamA
MSVVRNLHIFLIILFHCQLYGQDKVVISFVDDDNTGETTRKTIDSSQIYTQLIKVIQTYQKEGFLYSQLDTMYCQGDTCWAKLYRGTKYKIQSIRWSEELAPILSQAGFQQRSIKGKPIDSTLLRSMLTTTINHYSRHGHPYALAKIDSTSWSGQSLTARLNVDKGPFFEIDSIVINGKLKLQENFLAKVLGIGDGDPYDHSKITAIQSKLRQLPYLSLAEPPIARFINNKTNIYLKIDPVPASRFDVLVGVLPKTVNGSRQWNISGDILAELNNSLGYGEYLFAQYKGLKKDNAEVLLKSTIPYIGKSRIGSHLDFRFYRNASSNVDLYFDGGAQYIFNGFNNLKVLYNFRSSRLVTIDTIAILASKRLPNQLDVVYAGAGVSLEIRNLNYRFNPTKGYLIQGQTSVGRRKILENFTISNLEGFEASYDSLSTSSIQAEAYLLSAGYIPIRDWATIKIGNKTAIKYNRDGVRSNEYMRIGGNRTLRGFDEEEIFTEMYTYGTIEFRFVFDKNSYLSLPFIDGGVTRILQDNKRIWDKVHGVGLGLNFGTRAGIFNVSFAAGSRLGNPIDFSKLKVHFGYVSQF